MSENMRHIAVLRWGHRPQRDARLTSHVALAARAFGASSFILSDCEDQKIKETVEKISRSWGGDFEFTMGTPWKKAVENWRKQGGIVVHLTAYGENIESSNVLDRIKKAEKDIMIIVGSQKVPNEFYFTETSDFNVAIGNQPHSECASLAVFLDRFFGGKELEREFEEARIKIVPQRKGKRIVEQ
jgi:tRNA (cytidine56-2'-O)-methyltransferase